MKKQVLLGLIMMITGFCLCTNNQNSLKACTKEAAACSIKIKKEIKVTTTGYVEDQDVSFDLLMNPLTQL